MNEINEMILLYDFYGELLSDSQKEYFENYYFNNLSLSEIAENSSVSRNAVHKQIKNCIEKLKFYEEKLKLISKTELLKNKINEIENIKLKNEIIEIIES